MSQNKPVVLVTGASGQLGSLLVKALVARGIATIAGVRDLAKGDALAEAGASVRLVDYDKPETLVPAFQGIDRLVLISGSDMMNRLEHHKRVIAAAQEAGVNLLVYTSLLHAQQTTLPIAHDHRVTEDTLAASGLNYAVTRNGWYTENFMGAIASAMHQGVIQTCAGDARFSAAPRADYAEGIAALLAGDVASGTILEFAGSSSFNMAELSAGIVSATGKPVDLQQLSEEAYAASLAAAGLPAEFATVLASIDTAAQSGALFNESRTLEKFIGRETVSLDSFLRSLG